MSIYSNFLPNFQSLSELPALTIFRPQTAAGQFLTQHYRVHPDIADLLARVAGLGQEEERQ